MNSIYINEDYMSKESRPDFTKRDFLELGGRVVFLAIVAKLLGENKKVSAQDQTPASTSEISQEEISAIEEWEKNFESEPIFSQDFTQMKDGTQLDENFWTKETGIFNSTKETSTEDPSNVRIESQTLILQLHKTEDGYTGARLSTKQKFDFTFGKIEITAKFPAGQGAFGAIWCQSTDQSNSNSLDSSDKKRWSANGEIDIAEVQGGRPNRVYATAHTHESVTAGGNPNGGSTVVEDVTKEFYIYGMEWTPDKIVYTISAVHEATPHPFHSVERHSDDPMEWPFTHDFHLMLNLAAGGTWADSVQKQNSTEFENSIDDSVVDGAELQIQKVEYFNQKVD